MRRLRVVIVVAVIAAAVGLQACRQPTEPAPTEPGFVLVTIGDSITMGIQDAGLSYAFQRSNYPYLIAQQLGIASSFKQPYLKTDSPGIAAPPYKEPLKLENGEITAVLWEDETPEQIEAHVIEQIAPSTLLAGGAFHNLGVSGARLFDVRNTTHPENSEDGDNVFFTLVLQNGDSGTRTMLGQAKARQPDVAILWIGSNDVLHVALDGAGVDGSRLEPGNNPPTPVVDFATEYGALLADLAGAVENVLVATIPNYLPFAHALDGIYVTNTDQLLGSFASPALCVFDPMTFEPVNFGTEGSPLYLPLFLEEPDALHLLFTGAIAYMDLLEMGERAGLPNAVVLGNTPYELTSQEIDDVLSVYADLEWEPSEAWLPGETTLTQSEADQLRDYIDAYNVEITTAAALQGVPVVDMGAAWWSEAAAEGQSVYTLKHAIQDPDKTAFSLDGVHPGNLGQALSANAFIDAMNDNFGMSIPKLNVANYDGQYRGVKISPRALGALTEVRSQWQ